MTITPDKQISELYYSPASPYARKCRIIIIEKGLQELIKQTITLPFENPSELIEVNPLGTVPALKLSSEEALCESPVICEHLDSLSPNPIFYPAEHSARIQALALAALADGVIDAAIACVLETRRPTQKYSAEWVARKENAILRTLATIEKMKLTDNYPWHIGSMTVAVALDYLNFRLSHLEWQEKFPTSAEWLRAASQKPSMGQTAPE